MSKPDITSLAYLVFEVSDPEAWRKLLVDVVGATVGRTFGDGTVAYRLDERAARIFVTPGPADDLVALGFEAGSKAAMWDVAMKARDEGSFVEEALDADANKRLVQDLIRFDAPAGFNIELVYAPEISVDPLDRTRCRRGFVTGEQGVGHVALQTADVATNRRFFERVLGFRLSDHIRCTLRGNFEVDVTFLHVNPRHHTVALSGGVGKTLHHFMLQTQALDDVGQICDRFWDEDIEVTKTLGCHPNDRMVSFYGRTPSGFEIECGFGGVEIDDTCWEPGVYDHISSWGHRPPNSMKNPHRPRASAAPLNTERSR